MKNLIAALCRLSGHWVDGVTGICTVCRSHVLPHIDAPSDIEVS